MKFNNAGGYQMFTCLRTSLKLIQGNLKFHNLCEKHQEREN